MIDFPKKDAVVAKFIEIDGERAGQRIDNFLLSQLKGVPKSMIYRILRKGEVRVNKGRIKAQYRLQAGDIVRIPPVRLALRDAPLLPGKKVLQQIERNIIHEDERLIVLNKPSGIAVHGGSGISFGVIEAMRVLRPEMRDLELVHRLDRETSGCLLISKRRSALRELHELLRNGKMDKRYLALCKGKWRGGARNIDAPLRKNVLSSGERIVRISPDGKEALSRFNPQQRYRQATMMEVKLVTGRTHQIRVHALHTGHPLAGDDKYGDKGFNQEMKTIGLKRLFLHAFRLRFPWQGDVLELQAPLDEVLEQVLRTLR